MFKKVLIPAIIAVVVFAAGSTVYAQSGTNYTRYRRDTAPAFVLISDKEESKTFFKDYIIEALAKEGTEVSMNLYWFRSNDEKSIVVKKKSGEDTENEGSWILQESEKVTVGASNIYAKTVSLILGKNKIVLIIEDAKGNKLEEVLEIERFLKEEASKEVNGNTLNKFVKDISDTQNINE